MIMDQAKGKPYQAKKTDQATLMHESENGGPRRLGETPKSDQRCSGGGPRPDRPRRLGNSVGDIPYNSDPIPYNL